MGNISFNMLRLSLALLSFAEKSHELYFESVLCENDEVTLNCTVGNSIDDIKITIHGVQDTCSITDDVNKETKIALDSTSYSSCIGQHSCVLTDKMLNVSRSVLEKTRKLLIEFDCVRDDDNDHYRKPLGSVCSFNMKLVNCTNSNRKIEIQSVKLKQYLSFCENQNLKRSCTECYQIKVNSACNGKQMCEQLTNGCDDCSRLPKFVYISFSCKRVAVGVTVGLITIVGVIVVFIWFVRRKVSDDKQNTTYQRDENKYSIGNENNAIASNSNYEMLTTDQESRSYDELNQDFRKQPSRDQPDRNINKDIENEYIIPCTVTQKNKSKHANKDQTVNHVESYIGTGIREETKTSFSNSADYFKVL
ncbi:unnamed protein product [Mytilus edulis]|uniref:Uncharacterized protein n=1 Tax=Mytilus edulis TaxID=6550 RepID=A0A8S3RLT4_MYTED|nr:unnamed protein product [Mytilus edulis]